MAVAAATVEAATNSSSISNLGNNLLSTTFSFKEHVPAFPNGTTPTANCSSLFPANGKTSRK